MTIEEKILVLQSQLQIALTAMRAALLHETKACIYADEHLGTSGELLKEALATINVMEAANVIR